MIQLVLAASLILVAASPVPQESPTVLFVDSGQNLGDTRTFLMVLGDLDADGALDALIGAIDGQGGNRILLARPASEPQAPTSTVLGEL